MTDGIDVRCEPTGEDWTCFVAVAGDGPVTHHAVTVRAADLVRLGSGSTPDDLVRRSFEFLLAREPKESILPAFDLPLIGRYFPDYEATIKRPR
ncbi:MAG TPA: hypothetical protein VGM28_04840 [Candidatus Limnocylindrales bacterium]|jgi:hypothetical protein